LSRYRCCPCGVWRHAVWEFIARAYKWPPVVVVMLLVHVVLMRLESTGGDEAPASSYNYLPFSGDPDMAELVMLPSSSFHLGDGKRGRWSLPLGVLELAL
jgi:hypothetical protein